MLRKKNILGDDKSQPPRGVPRVTQIGSYKCITKGQILYFD